MPVIYPPSTPITAPNSLTALTGGGSALDGVAVNSLWVNRTFNVNDATHGFGVWVLEAGTDAAVAGDIVRPTNYNASTNAFVWKRKL